VIAAGGLALALSAPSTPAQSRPDQALPPRAVPVFEVDPSWPPKLPNGWVMGDPSSVTADRRDHVYVLHRPRTVPEALKANAAPPVLEFDPGGAFVRAWGGPADSYDWPDTEHGIFADFEDHLWIGGNNPTAQLRLTTRSDDMLLKFTTAGRFVLQVGGRDRSRGNQDRENPKGPADVFVHRTTDEAFVADGYGNRRVLVLDSKTGAFKRMWGAFGNVPLDPPAAAPAAAAAATPLDTEGPGPPQFGIVHGIKVSQDGRVYVADRGNRRVQVFTTDGKYVDQVFINRGGSAGNTASSLAFSPDPQQQFLYVADGGNGQVVFVDRRALTVIGSTGRRGAAPGEFQGLHHIAVDSRGNLYTAEVAPGRRVQRFRFSGMSRQAGEPSSR
jgi:hypothetical protein